MSKYLSINPHQIIKLSKVSALEVFNGVHRIRVDGQWFDLNKVPLNNVVALNLAITIAKANEKEIVIWDEIVESFLDYLPEGFEKMLSDLNDLDKRLNNLEK